MSDISSCLLSTPRRKRILYDDDDNVITPKKARSTKLPTPVSIHRRPADHISMPDHITRFQTLQTCLQLALSHALASSAVSPAPDTGIVPNVLNHFSLANIAGLCSTVRLDDLKRLCWLWEWDAKHASLEDKDDENPFLESAKPEAVKQWSRGGMGIVITPTMHLSKTAGKRVPAYGIGIEVEVDIDKDMSGGMAAVARWTAAGEQRKARLTEKLNRWLKLHGDLDVVPLPPLANLPEVISSPAKRSALTQRLASLSPKASRNTTQSGSSLPVPSSPSRTPAKPRLATKNQSPVKFAMPFPITPSSTPRRAESARQVLKTPSGPKQTPAEPGTSNVSIIVDSNNLTTPTKKTPSDSGTPQTPSSARRAALYERIRKRSESQPSTPTKLRHKTSTSNLTTDQILKLGQDVMRRRCLLGRLGNVAESIWMLFTDASTATTSSPTRKRRVFPNAEVVRAIVKSSPVPISAAEAQESIELLTSLCPFFLKSMEIGSEEWLEMPSSSMQSSPPTPIKGGIDAEGANILSPRRVRKEGGGLREVRETIKKELDLAIAME